MERILCPDKLSVEPTAINSEKEYHYWRKTFENFLDECRDKAPNKLRCLTKYVSASVYELISDINSYQKAIELLDSLYIKQKNIIFARHVLATRKQAANETIDEFLNELNKLSKNCEFETVTAEQYRQELVRDSFINGLQSNSIRERLLEYPSLTLDDASSTARSLDLAHRSSSSYVGQQTITCARIII